MGKNILLVVFLVAFGILTAVWAATNQNLKETQTALERAREEQATAMVTLDQGTIVGQVFVDNYPLGSLNNTDPPAQGFRVELYREVARTSSAIESIFIAEGIVSPSGEYRFNVLPQGEYYIIPLVKIDGYPSWDNYTCLKNPGNIKIKEGGETVLGPIFLLRR